eukprot:gnl/MRDRNA2_/MRDRNA2_131859_c0_seq1.p1 gnl/MRDRNA2_/MRDRNA2_131859_c0~~gnl/MRDRNA2_/MRDRNA2_131859_c0_seq1.p1  ORF type:complete len:289 (+),score=78.18 gnl/MRDRNA2_/MRDRNA2_131859_c0_seq1:89-955(+)
MGCASSSPQDSGNSTKEPVKEQTATHDDQLWAQKAASAPQDQQSKTNVTMKVEDADDEIGHVSTGKSKPQAPTALTVVPTSNDSVAPHTHAMGLNDSNTKKGAKISLPGGIADEEEDDKVGDLPPPPARKSVKPDRKTRKSMSANKAKRQTEVFAPSGAKAQELAQLLADLQAFKEVPPLDMKEVDEKKSKAKALADSGIKPCACSLFFFQVDTDHSEMLDRAELQLALWRIPNFNNALFEFKIAELFSEGDGWLDLDEWLDLAEELSDLKAEIEKEDLCRAWRELLL